MEKADRRVARTREQLQKALIELIAERGYDPITVQDIADRANVGRTTFYLHYTSKDDLFIGCHEAIAGQFRFTSQFSPTREEMLAPDAPPGEIAAYRHLLESKAVFQRTFQGKDSHLILRRIRDWRAHEIEASLRAAFDESTSAIPLDILSSTLAGAHIALVQWWLDQRHPHPPDVIAHSFHRMQRAAIADAFGLALSA